MGVLLNWNIGLYYSIHKPSSWYYIFKYIKMINIAFLCTYFRITNQCYVHKNVIS